MTTATASKVSCPRPSIPKSLVNQDMVVLIRSKINYPASWACVPVNVYDNKWRVNFYIVANPGSQVTVLDMVHSEFIEVVGSGRDRDIIREKSVFDCDKPVKLKKNIFS